MVTCAAAPAGGPLQTVPRWGVYVVVRMETWAQGTEKVMFLCVTKTGHAARYSIVTTASSSLHAAKPPHIVADSGVLQ